MALGYRNPQQQSWEDTFNWLTWDQFPAILEKSIEYFAVLPSLGTYRHINSAVRPFKDALLATTGRQFTLSGVGSMIDYEKYGHNIKRPSPQVAGTSCNGNTLCLEPTCFGFTEGVIESNNLLQDICWSLSMPCLKDYYYSDMRFDQKMESYFAMFFQQAPAVAQAYQRTRLIKEAIKVVATGTNVRYTGSMIGGSAGISLPFYMDPTAPTEFPAEADIPGGIGGFNMVAFLQYLAPRLLSDHFTGGMESVKVYGLKSDYYTAKEQTASVVDHSMQQDIIRQLALMGAGGAGDKVDAMLGDGFIADPMFPTFKIDGGEIIPITQEILEASTIAGYVQTTNPEHNLAEIRGLLFVPENWKFDLVSPPKDDFSDLGLGQGLNFRLNSPGSFPIMSSSMFSRNALAKDGVFYLGQRADNMGRVATQAAGIESRSRAINEAVRTELLLSYSSQGCAASGQLPNVGSATAPQGRADGFSLKSTMYLATAVKGNAKPVLVLFKTDTPRVAQPIVVCNPTEIDVDQTAGAQLIDCCGGSMTSVMLTFSQSMATEFAAEDLAIYRTGMLGASYAVEVTGVSGAVVNIVASDGVTILPCCAGGKDTYGTQGELISLEGVTARSSEIMKASCLSGVLTIELFDPIVGGANNAPATITLEDGSVVNVLLTATIGANVVYTVDAAGGETCDICDLDCACLVNAVFNIPA